jgi:hypothetical protein
MLWVSTLLNLLSKTGCSCELVLEEWLTKWRSKTRSLRRLWWGECSDNKARSHDVDAIRLSGPDVGRRAVS